jgi:hypothetical protein
VNPTDVRSNELQTQIPDSYTQQAIAGITEVAKTEGIELSDVDIELCAFLIHDVDSRSQIFYQSAKSAFRAALEMWSLQDLTHGVGS